jgi:spore germination cell wall hydrolase CwlJ-like protein
MFHPSLKGLMLALIISASPVTVSYSQVDAKQQQIECLATNAYFEAGAESHSGKLAVTNVVMNRATSGKFPKTPCAVIYQRKGNQCQFSWVCSSKSRIVSQKMYADSKRAAEMVYYRSVGDNTYGALFFHNRTVKPSWSRVYKPTVSIGNHIFYKG